MKFVTATSFIDFSGHVMPLFQPEGAEQDRKPRAKQRPAPTEGPADGKRGLGLNEQKVFVLVLDFKYICSVCVLCSCVPQVERGNLQ